MGSDNGWPQVCVSLIPFCLHFLPGPLKYVRNPAPPAHPQVLVDLIQYSCKPHPRPPRAGMKTLIVQGRILAEAIAQVGGG